MRHPFSLISKRTMIIIPTLITMVLVAGVSIAEHAGLLPKIYINNVPIVFVNKDNTVIEPVLIDNEVYVPLMPLMEYMGETVTTRTEDSSIYIDINSSTSNEIQITAENFDQYFNIKKSKSVNAKSAGKSSIGYSYFYDVTGEYTITVTALYPCDINNLTFNVNGHYYNYDEKGNDVRTETTTSFVMPASGVQTESKQLKWTANIDGLMINSSDDRLSRAEYFVFFVDSVTVKSGSITLKSN